MIAPQESIFAGKSIDFLNQRLASSQAYLLETRLEFADHILLAHSGWVASGCHKCRTFQQGIQSNSRIAEEAKTELKRLGKI